jgi:ribonuclease HI
VLHPIVLKEVIWQPPLFDWIKCNTNGASTSSSSACGGIFKNCNAEFLCGFAENTGLSSAFIAELCGAMNAIEIVASKNWTNLWLETDSTLVVMTFRSPQLVPWFLSNRWHNCIHTTLFMNSIVSHVFREGNFCADGLANVGLTLDNLTIRYEVPQIIRDHVTANKLGKPYFRVIHI